jgi:uncharacterized membrane protein YbhN (UPF0104 family)
MRRRWSTLLRLLVTLALLALLARSVGLAEVARAIAAADPWLFALALALCFVDRGVMIGKWYPLLHAQVPEVSPVRAARAYLAAGFASYFLPTSVGADALRSVALGRGRRAVAEVGASVVVERLLGLFGALTLSLVSLALARGGPARALASLLPWAAAGWVAVAVVLLALFDRRLANAVTARLPLPQGGRAAALAARLAAAAERYRQVPGTIAGVAAMSVGEQLFPVLVMWAIDRSLGLQIPFLTHLAVVPLAMFVGRLPISVAGLGVFEGALVGVFALYGVPHADALAIAVVARAAEIGAQLPGALFWSDLAARDSAPPEPAMSETP